MTVDEINAYSKMMSDRYRAVDAYAEVIPENVYDPCPCGCGKKAKFCPFNANEREERFIKHWLDNNPSIE